MNAKPGATVKVEQLRHEFWFGCAISNGFVDGTMPAADKAQYHEKFLQNFNAAVTENAVKWLSMERERGKVNYAVVDSMLAWTDRNHIPLRGHNLYWGIDKFVQPWLKEMSNDELRATLQRRAETVTTRYRGRFAEYDLNNEMVHGNFYEDRLGPGITKEMTTWAHNGDPEAKLFLNDYDILTGNKLPEYMAQIRSLLKAGRTHCWDRRAGPPSCRDVRPEGAQTRARFTGSFQAAHSHHRVQCARTTVTVPQRENPHHDARS